MSELYKLPAEWELKKLDDLANFQSGFAVNKKNEETDGYVHLRTHNISINGELNFDTFIKVKPSMIKEKLSYIEKGDILFNNTNSTELVGKTAIVRENYNYAFSNHLTKINVTNEVLSNFLVYVFLNLFNKKFFEKICNKWIGQSGVNTTMLKGIDIPLPPLAEQKRIVAKLNSLFEKIDKAIELHQQNITNANTLMASALDKTFKKLEGEYSVKKLCEFDKNMAAGGTPLKKEKDYWKGGTIDWYSSGELNQKYTLPSINKITEKGLNNSSAKLFNKGTLLIGMYDTAAMKMSILSKSASCNQAIAGFNPDTDKLDVVFAMYQLTVLKEKILEQRQGVRQKNLNLSKIRNIEIVVPPLPIQKQTIEYLDSIATKVDKIKQLNKQKLENLKALKASILDKAFRGEL